MIDVDTEAVRRESPEAFRVWREGRLRPYWLAAVRERRGRSMIDVERALGDGALRVEAGFMYPTWTFLCGYAVWLGCSVFEFTEPALAVPSPEVDAWSEDAEWEALFRVRYHPALVQNTMQHLDHRYGLISFGSFEAAHSHAVRTAGRSIGTQQVAGVTVADVVADLDAGRTPETRILRARWAHALNPIWALIAENKTDTVGAQVVAWMDSSLRLTIIATRETNGTVSVSMAAHHSHHGRVPLPRDEVNYWVPVLFTLRQIPRVTRRGNHSETSASKVPIDGLAIEYFTYTPPPAVIVR